MMAMLRPISRLNINLNPIPTKINLDKWFSINPKSLDLSRARSCQYINKTTDLEIKMLWHRLPCLNQPEEPTNPLLKLLLNLKDQYLHKLLRSPVWEPIKIE